MRSLPSESTTGSRDIFEAARAFAEKNEDGALALLKDLVLVNSWTRNKKGVDRVVEIIADFFQEGFVKRLIEEREFGNHLVVSTPAAEDEGFILMVGHTDTVFPPDSGFDWFRIEGGVVRGPGVIDMKGGLVVGMFAMKFLQEMGLAGEIPVKFIFNSDEEVGSPTSRELIYEEAKKACCGLVYECGGLGNTVVTGRRGKLGIKIKIHGKAGHAGMVTGGKKSAILELAHKVIEFERLNEVEDGINCNVGVVSGGVAPNVVPDRAQMEVDIRYLRASEREKVFVIAEEIVKKSFVDGVSSECEIVSERPAMERNEANLSLFNIVRDVGAKLGLEIKEELRYGVSDANIVAHAGIPVVDGLGPIGDKDHSDEEYMVKSSLKERIMLSCVLLCFLNLKLTSKKGGDA